MSVLCWGNSRCSSTPASHNPKPRGHVLNSFQKAGEFLGDRASLLLIDAVCDATQLMRSHEFILPHVFQKNMWFTCKACFWMTLPTIHP